jgi:diguanylate cyclase (GGDEF)-like protein
MRIEIKSLFIIASTITACATVALISATNYHTASVLIISVVAIGVLFTCIYLAIIRPMKLLIQQLLEINTTNSLTKRLHTSNNHDEIAKIATSINHILDNAQISMEKQEERLNHNIDDLLNNNQELKNEMAHLKPIASKVVAANSVTTAPRIGNNNLPDRIYFNGVLTKAIEHASRHKTMMAVLLVDIHVTNANDTKVDNSQADPVIAIIAKLLEKTLRTEDILAKLEGAEFIILINKIDKPQFASIVAEKLLTSLAQPIMHNNQEYTATASIGISTYPDDGISLNELLTNVDTALHRAKAKGGNNYQFCSQETNVSAHEYIEIEKALHNAIENNELTLYYQPKLNVKKGSITGLEALLRWINPNFGIVYPLQFLSIADETGFFLPMAEWVIREACKTNKYWQDEGFSHLVVSVNLTAKQFHHPKMAGIISRALEDYKLNPKYLEIEVDEKTIMEDVDATSNTLNAIKETGVRLSVDHFGTGYTCISYLKTFPITTIKIDSSFIKGVPNNPNDTAITNSFIALSHQLGIEVVAEGVETAEQVQYLSDKNCDLIQGYFLSHPLPADKIKLKLSKLSEEVLV